MRYQHDNNQHGSLIYIRVYLIYRTLYVPCKGWIYPPTVDSTCFFGSSNLVIHFQLHEYESYDLIISVQGA